MNQGITIRMGASAQSLQAGPTVFDMASMDKTQRYELRRTLIETLKQQGYFGKKHQRRAQYSARRRAA